MQNKPWPDVLSIPASEEVQHLLNIFWVTLARLPDLLHRGENLLLHALISDLRRNVVRIMLAANGIQEPAGTRHLNTYLGKSQRQALEKTLVAPDSSGDTWIAQAVALTVIYRWYAPQLIEKYNVTAPTQLESETLLALQNATRAWPLVISTGTSSTTESTIESTGKK